MDEVRKSLLIQIVFAILIVIALFFLFPLKSEPCPNWDSYGCGMGALFDMGYVLLLITVFPILFLGIFVRAMYRRKIKMNGFNLGLALTPIWNIGLVWWFLIDYQGMPEQLFILQPIILGYLFDRLRRHSS